MIDLSKKYRHVDGYEVELYAIKGTYVLAGKKYGGEWISAMWKIDTDQLIEVKPRHKRTAWLNVYEDHAGGALKSKEDADRCAGYGRIACIKVELDFEEGEGL